MEQKFILDYNTLFNLHSILDDFHDCTVVLPYSSVNMYNTIVKDLLADDDFTAEEKRYISNIHSKFTDFIFKNIKTYNSMNIANEKMISEKLCYNPETNFFIEFTAPFDETYLAFSEKTIETLNTYDFDVLNSSIYFNIPIVTINEELLEIIQNDNLPVEYIIPEED